MSIRLIKHAGHHGERTTRRGSIRAACGQAGGHLSRCAGDKGGPEETRDPQQLPCMCSFRQDANEEGPEPLTQKHAQNRTGRTSEKHLVIVLKYVSSRFVLYLSISSCCNFCLHSAMFLNQITAFPSDALCMTIITHPIKKKIQFVKSLQLPRVEGQISRVKVAGKRRQDCTPRLLDSND